MEEQPLFSVLVANYNNGQYLQEAIDSVLEQTYTKWEVVIVDDGSTDNSHELYDKFSQDARFRIFYNETNMGCGYTKRRVAELASGELCGFLDADDILLSEALKAHVQVHTQNPDVSIVYSRNYFCDKDGNIIRESPLITPKKGETYFDYRWSGAMNFASYKKSFYLKTSGISAKLRAGVDQDLYFKLEEKGEIFILDKFTYKYMQRSRDSINSNNTRLWYWNLAVRRDACMRRGLDIDEVLYDDWEYIINHLIIKSAVYEKEKEIRTSLPYRLGKTLIQPIKFVKKILFHPSK